SAADNDATGAAARRGSLLRADGAPRRAAGGQARDPATGGRGLAKLVGHAREDYSRLEEEKALDVESALVVQQPCPAAHDELRQDDDRHRVGVGGEAPDVLAQGLAE